MPIPVTTLSVFKRLCHESMVEVLQDWKMIFELDIEAGESRALEVSGVDQILGSFTGACVAAQTRIECGEDGPLLILFPKAFAIRASGMMTMIPEDAIEERITEGIQASDMEAFQELINIFCGSSNNVYRARHRSLNISQGVDDLKLTVHRSGGRKTFSAFPAGPLVLVHFPVEVCGHTYSIVQILSSVMVQSIANLFLRQEAA